MKIRKAILTGGGRATRLRPITSTINKHLLPLANKAMIFHAIEKVVDAGIEEIFINTNPGETSLQDTIGDGGHWGVRITYFEQTGGPQGIAHVVHEAKKFIGDDPFLFYLSDNILIGGIQEMIREFQKNSYDCMLALCTVPDPQRFGVPIFSSDGKLVDVVEKPGNPPNNYAVIGAYIYAPKIFFDAFNNIEKSTRGEYEISDIHSYFLKNNRRVGYKEVTGWWQDTGKPDNLLLANKMLLDAAPQIDFICAGVIDPGTHMQGNVSIGTGSRIGKNVRIIGPVMIGENTIIEESTIGPHVTIGSGCEIQFASLENSILLDNVTIKRSVHLVHSLLGKGVQILFSSNQEKKHRMVLGDHTVVEF